MNTEPKICPHCGEELTPTEIQDGVCWTCLEDPFLPPQATATAEEWPDFHTDNARF